MVSVHIVFRYLHIFTWYITTSEFGQRNNLTQTDYFRDPLEFFHCVSDPANIVSGVYAVHADMVRVVYKKETDFVEVLKNTNAVIAAYTTCQARLKLYSYIEQLQERVLYFDTGL